MDWYYEKYNLKVNTNAIGSAEYKQTQIIPITPLPINIKKNTITAMKNSKK